MERDWVELGALDSLPDGEAVLRKVGERRLVCVRRGDAVHALDDRCPHQGYPLSQGEVSGGVLTCSWHNWKFELATGECTFGGEAVKRFPARVEDGRVHLDLTVDEGAEAARFEAGFRRALLEDAPARGVREGLRLGGTAPGRALGRVDRAFEVLVEDGAARAEYGFDHALAMSADLASWVERGWLDGAEALAVAVAAVGDESKRLPRRPVPRATTSTLSWAAIDAALVGERRDEAETRARVCVRSIGAERTAREALLPFVARHVLDYGHGAIFLTKALELARRFPAAAEELLAASTVELGWATAETSLPPFAATREAAQKVDAVALGDEEDAFDRAALELEVLASERRAVAAVLAALEARARPREVLFAIANASATRLTRFDDAWEESLTAEVGVLDVSHALTFAEAILALTEKADPRFAARLAVLSAGFLGKLKKADFQGSRELVSPRAPDLLAAVRARDLGDALAHARELDRAARRAAYRTVAPFAALDAGVRPIFQAHHVKVTEACSRLEALDPRADGAYLEACLTLLTPRRRERGYQRVAAVAQKFLADGRPPEGLY